MGSPDPDLSESRWTETRTLIVDPLVRTRANRVIQRLESTAMPSGSGGKPNMVAIKVPSS